MIGIAVLSLPFHAYKAAGHDGWISILISGFLVQLFVFLIWLLNKRFPNHTLFDYSKIILGTKIGNIINFIYIIYLLLIVSYIFIIMNEIIIRWILPKTPEWVLLIMGIVLLVYGCMGTVKNMVSLFSFLFIFILFLFFISLLTFNDPIIDVRNLFPIGSSGVVEIFKGTKHTITAFIGFETLLFYLAFVKQPNKLSSIKGASIAVLFVTLFNTYLAIISFVIFSSAEMRLIPEPVLYMLRAIDMTILQRFDLVFLSIWSLVVATTVLSYGFLGSMGISKLLHVKHNIAVILAGIFTFFTSILIFHFIELIAFDEIIMLLNLIFGVIIPLLLLIIAIVLKRERESNHVEK